VDQLPLYRIVDWGQHFECAQSRKHKALKWVAVPNKFDGDGYTVLVDHADGAAHYGAWCAIMLVASRCDPPGTLVRASGEPHTADSIARMTRIPAATITVTIARLTSRDIGWLEVTNDPPTRILPGASQVPTKSPPPQYITGQDKTGQNTTGAGAPAPPREAADTESAHPPATPSDCDVDSMNAVLPPSARIMAANRVAGALRNIGCEYVSRAACEDMGERLHAIGRLDEAIGFIRSSGKLRGSPPAFDDLIASMDAGKWTTTNDDTEAEMIF